MRTEFANGDRAISSAMVSCAAWCQAPLETILEHRAAGTLGEFIEQRRHVRTKTGAEALREIDAKRFGPGENRREPAALLGQLRAQRLIWQVEERELQRRPLDPQWALEELRRKQIPPWWGMV